MSKEYTHSVKFYDRETKKSDYVKGISMSKPADWRPDFVVSEMGINLPAFREWLSEQIQAGRIDKDGWVNLDVLESDPSRANGATPPMPEFENGPAL